MIFNPTSNNEPQSSTIPILNNSNKRFSLFDKSTNNFIDNTSINNTNKEYKS